MPGSWKMLRAGISVISSLIDPDKAAGFKGSFLFLVTDDLIENSALQTGNDAVQKIRLICQRAAEGHAHFFKVHSPALGKRGNHC